MNKKQGQPAMAKNVKEMTVEQLKALYAELQKAKTQFEENTSTMQIKVSDDIAAMKGVAQQIVDFVMPQIEFDIRFVTDVVVFQQYLDSILKDGRVTITTIEFKRIIRSLSNSKFKGHEAAFSLDQLSAMFEKVAQTVAEADQSYQQNATVIVEIENELDMRANESAEPAMEEASIETSTDTPADAEDSTAEA